ncbi:hypothetical protein [Trebonia kvetii]|uniref:hypothetical protein n=1 Tax=Trebonia kvetii TaxID=2480626 RepID=UPI001C9E21EA|nr:hypothetical protein [Trebonia kvetii]
MTALIDGKAIAARIRARVAAVTSAHSKTGGLAAVTGEADILVAAAGVRGLIGAEHVKPGATVIDVGIHRAEAGLAGDVRAAEVTGIAARLNPRAGRRRPDDDRHADGQHAHRRPLVTRLKILIYREERVALPAARE